MDADQSQQSAPDLAANFHAALDRAVRVAYGWDYLDSAATSDETILERLLALSLVRAAMPMGKDHP